VQRKLAPRCRVAEQARGVARYVLQTGRAASYSRPESCGLPNHLVRACCHGKDRSSRILARVGRGNVLFGTELKEGRDESRDSAGVDDEMRVRITGKGEPEA